MSQIFANSKLRLNLMNSKVLIVDDQPLSLIVMKKILSKNFLVTTVNSGEKAIEMCELEAPDLILLDIAMDGISGIETCNWLKKNDRTKNIPVIFVTSFENQEDACWEAGGVDFINKPIKPKTLFKRVRAHLTIKIQHDLLLQKVFFDDLTQVFNRRYFNAHADKVELNALREKKDYALLLIDIDYFKQYNDIYGHVQGDVVLKLIAKTITNSLHRPTDFVARYGGEEFVVVLPNTSENGALHVAESIKSNVLKLGILHKHSEFNFITISIGGATLCPHKENKNILEIADKKLYQSKVNGRNQVCF